MERDFQFRSEQDQARGFILSIFETRLGRSIEEWAVEFAACWSEEIRPGLLGDAPAILCSRHVMEEYPAEPAALAEYGERLIMISAGSALTDSEFMSITESFRF
jgi:hypothetical protein